MSEASHGIQAFDPFATEVIAQGPSIYAALAESAPLVHYRGRFDFYISSNPEDIAQGLLGDVSAWTVDNGSTPKQLPPEMCIALNSDSPRAMKVRHVVQRGFAPSELKRLAGVVDDLADELIDAMLAIPDARGNFYELFAKPLPARLNCLMMGLPDAGWKTVKEWADVYFYSSLNEPNVILSAELGRVFSDPVFALVAERRALLAEHGLEPDLAHVGTVLPNDFLSRFLCDRVDGELLGDDEIHSLMVGIILGGNETTMMLMTNLARRLLEVPQRWEAVKADPALLEVAVEECLRLDPPIYGMFRSPRRDVAVDGGTVPQGAKVMYNIPAANRDPAQWPDPGHFRLDRPLSQLRKHFSFAKGTHSCLGAPLARMEVRRVFETLARRLPRLRLDPCRTPERAPGFSIYGWTGLPVIWS